MVPMPTLLSKSFDVIMEIPALPNPCSSKNIFTTSTDVYLTTTIGILRYTLKKPRENAYPPRHIIATQKTN